MKKRLNLTEAAEYLEISRATLYRLIKEGRVRYNWVRKTRRIPVSELDRYLEMEKPR